MTEDPDSNRSNQPEENQSGEFTPDGNSTSAPPASNEAPRSANDPNEQFQDLKRKAVDAFQSGTSDAREAVQNTFPKAREDFAKGVGDASYAIGYALSFGSTLIREMSPQSVTEGFERGTRAGSRAAEEVIAQRKTRSTPDDDAQGPPAS